MSDITVQLAELSEAVKSARYTAERKEALLNKAQLAYEKAHEALCDTEWEYDDLLIQTWDKPDIKALLNSEHGGRVHQELLDIINSRFNKTLYVGGQWSYAACLNQLVLSVHLDAGAPDQVEKAEEAILFFSVEMDKNHPDAPGCCVFPVTHNLSDESAYEIWYIPITGQAILSKRVDRAIVDKAQFDSVRDCLTYVHQNLSYNYSD